MDWTDWMRQDLDAWFDLYWVAIEAGYEVEVDNRVWWRYA